MSKKQLKNDYKKFKIKTLKKHSKNAIFFKKLYNTSVYFEKNIINTLHCV